MLLSTLNHHLLVPSIHDMVVDADISYGWVARLKVAQPRLLVDIKHPSMVVGESDGCDINVGYH